LSYLNPKKGVHVSQTQVEIDRFRCTALIKSRVVLEQLEPDDVDFQNDDGDLADHDGSRFK